MVRATHVNILDLVDTPNTGEPVMVFSSLEALKAYTISKGKFFPLENAYAGGVLRYLLREILNTYEGGKRNGKRRRRGRGGGRGRTSGRGNA